MFPRGLLRAAAVATPLLVLLHCGDSADLVIGHYESPNQVLPDGSSGGGDAMPDAPGDAPTPVGGDGGGGGEVGGSGGDVGGSGGEGNVTNCVTGEIPPATSLIHRYDFSGSTTTIVDLAGDADGELIGADETNDDGVLLMSGDVGQETYVNLPNGIVSSLGDSDATFIAWVIWEGGAGYQRIFDFGTNDNGEDQRGHGEEFFVMMPFTGQPSGNLVVEIYAADEGIDQLFVGPDIEEDIEHQLALVLQSGESMAFYMDGVLLNTVPTVARLGDINDVNAWLGRSNFDSDNPYNGTYNEFRIYNQALSACAIETLYDAGPDVLP